MTAIEKTPVLIVGAGPAGLTASLALSRLGIEHVLVDKHPGPANSPRAHITNQRTMEIFRHLGVENDVLAVATPAELMSNNVWVTTLAGLELGRLQTWGTGPDRAGDYAKASPSPMCNCPQHIMEPILLEAIRAAGVADVRFCVEFTGLEQDTSGVSARLTDRADGSQHVLRAQYVVGADGGRSRVVSELGLEIEGELGLAFAANVWFEADLTRLCAHRPGVLYWNASPGKDYWIGAGTLICVRPWTEWVMLFMYDDPADEARETALEAVLPRVRKVLGDDNIAIDVKAVSSWQINHACARHYGVGRVLCAGDAVHRHPPANGLGTNTSVADGFNVAWKLAMVLDGTADPSLLDSYSAERQPVGRQVVDRALQSVQEMAAIPAALGFTSDQDEAAGWQSIDELFANSERGAARRQELRDAIALTDYQFNAHGVELGYRYATGAVVDEEPEPPAPPSDPELYYHPTTRPGARVPHAWLDDGDRRCSTLDLVRPGRFVLLTGIGGEAWTAAAAAVAQRLGVPVDAFLIGTRDGLCDVYGDWERQREVTGSGCVLVRPDAHVAWRAFSIDAEPEAALLRSVSRILGRAALPD